VIFEAFDVVVVPFPLTDRRATKRRPALVLSAEAVFNTPAGHLVLAMITSADNAPWPLDTPVTDLASAGLPAPSVVRMKLFTLDAGLVLRRAGALGNGDRKAVKAVLSRLLG
jgi:mRNA interferase MazF